ncbi:hypothetical protein ACFE04_005279 [Oxalis oulophora]
MAAMSAQLRFFTLHNGHIHSTTDRGSSLYRSLTLVVMMVEKNSGGGGGDGSSDDGEKGSLGSGFGILGLLLMTREKTNITLISCCCDFGCLWQSPSPTNSLSISVRKIEQDEDEDEEYELKLKTYNSDDDDEEEEEKMDSRWEDFNIGELTKRKTLSFKASS